ncbi:MAG TPA: hypothetical protein VKU94_00925 [Geobacterales bacterium]|nr:hypothetical protein [Geobacterales bacterium]
MAANFSDYLVIFTLLAIISLAFINSLPLIYLDKNYFEDQALLRAVQEINNAIQFVYSQPLSSLTIKIYLPQGAWIYITKNYIGLSKKIFLELNDPNHIIKNFNGSYIFYNFNFSNTLIINNNINYIRILCISLGVISVAEL